MTVEEQILRAEKLVSAIWKLGIAVVAVGLFFTSAIVWLTKDFVRYRDKIFLDVPFGKTVYRVDADMQLGSGAPLYLSSGSTDHNFQINRTDKQ